MKIQKIGTRRLNQISAIYTDQKLEFASAERERIEDYRLNNNHKFEDNPMYGVIAMQKVHAGRLKKDMEIKLGSVLYSYFVATRMLDNIRMVPIVAPISAVITKDNYVVMGKMNQDTISAGKIQFVGGSLDENDIDDNRNFSLEHNIKRETMEELGVTRGQIHSVKPSLLIQLSNDKNNVVVVHETKLNLTKDQLLDQYQKEMAERKKQRLILENNGEKIPDSLKQEFAELVCIPLTKEGIREYRQNEGEKRVYAAAVLNYLYRQQKKNRMQESAKVRIQSIKDKYFSYPIKAKSSGRFKTK